jgi:hypothetical protein
MKLFSNTQFDRIRVLLLVAICLAMRELQSSTRRATRTRCLTNFERVARVFQFRIQASVHNVDIREIETDGGS